MSASTSIHPGDAVYAKHWQSAFAAPLCHISIVDIWICHCVSGLQNVFIIGFYYKQRRPVLKNEVKKTTTRPRRPSGPKWTTHRVSAKHVHKGHIRIQANGKQTPRPTLKPRRVLPVRDSRFRKQRRRCRGVTESAVFLFYFFSVHVCTCANLAQRQTQTLLCGSSHPGFQSVFCGRCLCLYVSRGGGRKWESKGFNFI